MRKNMLVFVLLLFLGSCSSMIIDETGREFDDVYIKKTVGKCSPFLSMMDRNTFDASVKMWRETTIMDSSLSDVQVKERLAEIDSLEFAENQYFWFSLLTSGPYRLNEERDKISFVDSKGNNLIYSIISIDVIKTTSENGTFFQIGWAFKTVKPISSKSFGVDELPVLFTAIFLNDQKVWYEYMPEE